MLGTTRASIEGSLLDPLHLKGEELNFKLEGSDLALLFPIIGLPFPPTPAYKLEGFWIVMTTCGLFAASRGRWGKAIWPEISRLIGARSPK
jgi:hypothetical protein